MKDFILDAIACVGMFAMFYGLLVIGYGVGL